jgi:hypothetical protein
MQYIHKDCILRWATIDGHINHARLACSICTEPYRINMINLETFLTGVYAVDLVLYNPTWVSFAINYLSLFYGIYEGETLRHPLHTAQVITYLLYAILVCVYVRIQNVEMYADALIERRAYLYWLIQVYSSYNAYTGNYEIMTVTAILAHNLMWREHVAALRHVNRRLLGVYVD